MASIRGVVNTLLQTAKFGTPLAQSLRVLAAEFREARMTRAEEKAARLPALLTVPMIVFILPTLFIVVLGPAILSVLDTFSGRARDKPTEVTQTVRPGAAGRPAHRKRHRQIRAGQAGQDRRTRAAAARRPRSCRCRSRCGPAISSRSMPMPARCATARQHRLVLVPAGTPDDAVEAVGDGMPIAPDRVRVSLPAPAPGPNEVRLYYVPPSGSAPQVAARAAVTVTSGES